MKLSPDMEAEVAATMERYAEAYKKKDIARFSEIFSPDITGFGSGPDEIIGNHRDLIRQIKRDVTQADILDVAFTSKKIFGDGRVAWVTSESTMTFTADGSKKEKLSGRSTMVLRNTGNRWRIEQLHFSLPCGGQAEGQSFPTA